MTLQHLLFAALVAASVGCTDSNFTGESRTRFGKDANKDKDGDLQSEDKSNEDTSAAKKSDDNDDGGLTDTGNDEDGPKAGGSDGDATDPKINSDNDSDGDGKIDINMDEVILGTDVDRVGVSFEDSTDQSDWDARDVFVCVNGKFKVDGSRKIKSASKTKQKARVVTHSSGACHHHIFLRVYKQDGTLRSEKQVESRGINETLDVAWYYGDRIDIAMKAYTESEPGQCLPLGETPHTNTNTQRVQWFGSGTCPAEVSK